MADQQMRPATPQQAPDPSFNYERSHPERESPGGSLENKAVGRATPVATADAMGGSITNAQNPSHSLTAQDASPPQAARGLPNPVQPDHSMAEEEPLGWDQAPNEGGRHPRIGGQGGTPDVGKSARRS